MKVTVENKKGLNKDLKIFIDKKTMNSHMDEKYEEIKGTVNLKGFRPGKVPREILKRQFGQAIFNEVLDKVLKETSTKALEENKIKPAGQPKLDLKIYGEDKEWSDDKHVLLNWINGKTNEPFVNANMIELLKTGFMSNRGRQNVSNYLTKELKIDWRIGAEYFESMLIDYDVHSNYGNWLYNAGIGNDSMPFRKFNPRLQSERYDPDKLYEKIWLNG